MKTTLIHEPVCTWVGNDLFCGAIFFCRLTRYGQSNGREFFRLELPAFPDAVSEAGWDHWGNRPFDMKTADVDEAKKLVESFYRTVFDDMEFKVTLE